MLLECSWAVSCILRVPGISLKCQRLAYPLHSWTRRTLRRRDMYPLLPNGITDARQRVPPSGLPGDTHGNGPMYIVVVFFFHAPLKLAAETARQSELSFPHDKARLSTAGDDLRSEPDTRRSRDDATMHSGTGKHARPAASCASRGDGLPEERRPCHLDRGVPLSFGVRGSEGRGPCLRGQGR